MLVEKNTGRKLLLYARSISFPIRVKDVYTAPETTLLRDTGISYYTAGLFLIIDTNGDEIKLCEHKTE